MTVGVCCEILPTSSSACIILFILLARALFFLFPLMLPSRRKIKFCPGLASAKSDVSRTLKLYIVMNIARISSFRSELAIIRIGIGIEGSPLHL